MSRTSLLFLASLCSVALIGPGCNLLDAWRSSDSYRGTYSWGFEVSEFRSCNSTKHWWVGSDDPDISRELVTTYRTLRNDTMYQQVFVKLKGQVSERGTYGHVGAYEREFMVEEIVEIRQLAPDECNTDAAR